MTRFEFHELAKTYGLKLEENCQLTCVEDEKGQRILIEDLTPTQFRQLLGF